MATLPPQVQKWLENRLQDAPIAELKDASQILSSRYRAKVPGRQLAGVHTIEAYLAARMPATFATVSAVLNTLQQLAPDWDVDTLYDLGAGPGTASLAAHQAFPGLRKIHLLESESAMIQAGKSLFATLPQLGQIAQWHHQKLPGLAKLQTTHLRQAAAGESPASLTILSYVLNELTPSQRQELILELLAIQGILIAIEPGTPAGFTNILNLRQDFLAKGWVAWAPCPHNQACPIKPPDWCHFSERLPRSALHRYLKQGSQNFEDEKYAYLILSRHSISQTTSGRILRHPLKHKGHLELTLCTAQGIEKRTVARSEANYRLARKVQWGDNW